MNQTRVITIARCAGIILFFAAVAQSALITTPPVGGQVIPIQDPGSLFFDTPVVVSPGVTAISTNPDGSWIGPGPYTFVDNGSWDNSVAMVAVDTDLAGSDPYRVTLFFATPVAGVGGFFNYATFFLSNYSDVILTAWGADGSVLESVDLFSAAPISTPAGINQGEFRGFLRPSPDIASFSIENSSAALTDLTVFAGAAVPEPASISLVCFALAIAVVYLWLCRLVGGRDAAGPSATCRAHHRRSTILGTASLSSVQSDAMYLRSSDRKSRFEMRRVRTNGLARD